MKLILDKTNFKFGETIKGKAFLDLKEATKARGVRAVFYGEEETTSYSSKGGKTSIRRVNEIKIMLEEGEKDYRTKEYEFEIGIPQYTPINTGAKIDLGLLSLNLGGKTSTVKWFIEASLDIPMGFDVSKKIQLNIV
ncbi:MAG: hypothetical protein ABIA76_00825 [Candidatus Diapherotrites archaeon]